MRHTDHTAKGREEVMRFLELLKTGCTFFRVATDGLGAVDKEYGELVQEVKEEEEKYQGKQNTELEFKFSKLQGEFTNALTTRADREIKEAASGGGEVDALTTRADREINEALDEELTPRRHDEVFIQRMTLRLPRALRTPPSSVQFLWSYASLIFSREVLDKFVSDCEKGRDILGWFRDVENIAKERREQCVNGCVLSCLSQSTSSLKLIS